MPSEKRQVGRHVSQQTGGRISGSMIVEVIWEKILRPAFLLGVLALFLSTCLYVSAANGQTIKDLPPPPPVPKPKPTLTPKPPANEVLDVVKVTSNLVMVPVSVTDQRGQAIQGLQVKDFRL